MEDLLHSYRLAGKIPARLLWLWFGNNGSAGEAVVLFRSSFLKVFEVDVQVSVWAGQVIPQQMKINILLWSKLCLGGYNRIRWITWGDLMINHKNTLIASWNWQIWKMNEDSLLSTDTIRTCLGCVSQRGGPYLPSSRFSHSVEVRPPLCLSTGTRGASSPWGRLPRSAARDEWR